MNFDGSSNVTINTRQNNIAVLNGKITLTNGSGTATTNYPTGFTYNNCVVIAVGIDIYGEGYFSYNIAGQMVFEGRLGDDVITVKSISIDGIGSSSTKNYRLVLMKLPTLTEKDYIVGDINNDNSINQTDLRLLSEYLEGKNALTNKQLKSADVNRDNTVDTGDTYKLSRYINGQIPNLD